MALAPVEILTLVFPGNNFTGTIIPELSKLVDNETITVIDGLFVIADDSGDRALVEFDELGANADVASLSSIVDHSLVITIRHAV